MIFLRSKYITKEKIDLAGFFGFFDYTKPGPGVPKDAPPKARIIVFFEILGRKFWKLVSINLMFFLFNLPATLLMMFITGYFIPQMISDDPLMDLMVRFIFGAGFLCIPVITVGPAQAGFTYILRNYAREEHAFPWWDFKDAAKSNFKQSLIVSVINILATALVGLDLNLYFRMNTGNNFLLSMASGFMILAFVIFLMMNMYIYPMMITFNLSIKQLYKNAFIFSVMRFFPNLGMLILCFGLIILSFLNTIIGFILFPLLTMSLIGLITNFYVYPVLKKYIIDKYEEEHKDDAGEKTEEAAPEDGSNIAQTEGKNDSAGAEN